MYPAVTVLSLFGSLPFASTAPVCAGAQLPKPSAPPSPVPVRSVAPEPTSMMDTSADDAFDPLVSVYVDTAHYLWNRGGISVDLPLCVSVAGRRSRSNAVTRFNAVVDCSRTWRVEPNIRDSLVLDSADVVASTVLGRRRGERMDYDVMLRALDALLAGCFVIFHDYVATADALRYELARDTHLDLALNILVRNECLRRGGTYWSRTRGNRAPLAQLWTPFFGVDAVPNTAAEIARGLLDMYAAIEAKARPTAYVDDAPFNIVRRWHSSPARLRPLVLSFNVEYLFGRE